METEMQIRKTTRLKGFDYSSAQYYFVTVCTNQHRCYFGMVIPDEENGKMKINKRGEIVKKHIINLDSRYQDVYVDKYVIMPNHLHMIVVLDKKVKLTLAQIIGLFKSGVSREVGAAVWQRSFYDHIIRDEKDYQRIWEYIDTNPAKWAMDKYYVG